MLKEYKLRTNLGIAFGFVLIFVGQGFYDSSELIAGVASLAGLISFVWGTCSYSQGKGYHPAWGLLGVFTILGLVILFFFPDKHRDSSEASLRSAQKTFTRSALVAMLGILSVFALSWFSRNEMVPKQFSLVGGTISMILVLGGLIGIGVSIFQFFVKSRNR